MGPLGGKNSKTGYILRHKHIGTNSYTWRNSSRFRVLR